MSDEILGNMSEEELNAILESDDPELIEKMLNGSAAGTPATDDESKADDEESQTTIKPAEIKTEEESAASSAQADETVEQKGAYVESKHGGNKIPYSVLEDTRTERNLLKNQLAEAQSKLSAFENQSQKVSSFLEKKGIDLTALERGETLTPEQMEDLEELDPAIAHLARLTISIQEQQKALAEQISSAREPQVTPLELAIRENSELNNWRKSDPDRWDTATKYDSLLMQDPAFQNSSLDERFAEAVKRTKLLFNDSVDQSKTEQKTEPKIPRESAAEIAAKKVAAATQKSVPRSLTDIGATPSTERSFAETLGDLSDDTLLEKMSTMSSAQIDKMLASM